MTTPYLSEIFSRLLDFTHITRFSWRFITWTGFHQVLSSYIFFCNFPHKKEHKRNNGRHIYSILQLNVWPLQFRNKPKIFSFKKKIVFFFAVNNQRTNQFNQSQKKNWRYLSSFKCDRERRTERERKRTAGERQKAKERVRDAEDRLRERFKSKTNRRFCFWVK